MNKKLFSSVISFVLVFSVLCCGSVSASAYDSLITFKSDEWSPIGNSILSFVYPNFSIDAMGGTDDCLQYTDLYGDTCYIPYGSDEIIFVTGVELEFNSADFKYNDFYIFTHNTYVYLINFDSSDVMLFLDENEYLYFFVPSNDLSNIEIDFYTLSYPFNVIKKSRTVTVGWTNCDYEYDKFFRHFPASGLAPDYSTCDIYDYETQSVKYQADPDITEIFSDNFILEKNLIVYRGFMTVSLTSSQIQRFALGKYAFRFDNIGYIPFSNSSYSYFKFGLDIYDSDVNDYGYTLVEYEPYNKVFMSYPSVAAGSSHFNDFIVYWDNNLISDTNKIDEFYLYWDFACDVTAAFFPGTVEIIEYESYEDDLEHDDILYSVNNAASVISGQISSSSSALSSEIVNAATDIQDSINISSANIVSSVQDVSDKLDNVKDEIVNAADNVTNKLDDVKDGITNKLTEIKDNLLDGIKSFFIPSDEVMEEIDNNWDELLKTRLGALYEVSDIITDFANEMSWDYVSQAGEKNTITMPSVTVRLVDTDFTFGGYEVNVVPEGFDVLTTALKGITSIVCTLLFVNALRRKYDKLVGGSSA